jgi:hypothetical protein
MTEACFFWPGARQVCKKLAGRKLFVDNAYDGMTLSIIKAVKYDKQPK